MASLRIEMPRPYGALIKPARYKGAFGGRGGGKSHAFATLLIIRCLRRVCRAICVREFQRTLEQSVMSVIIGKIRAFGLEDLFHIMRDHIETPGGGRIGFEGMAAYNAENIKSLEGYDVAWVEEAQVLSQRSLDLLRPTIRVPDSELWFSWNPRNETDPVDKFLRKDPPDDAVIVETSYRDNPWLSDVMQAEMEWDRGHDPEKYAHVWLGKYEQLTEARVFKNWRIEDFDTPKDVTFYFGGDWGFAQDPTVLVRCWIDGRRLYIDREAYRIGCEIEDTPALFDALDDGMAREWTITADSARPETISHMKRHGYPRIRAANKGPGSVEEGVKFLQGYDIIVHPRCKHTIDELTLYRYKTDPRTGQVLPKLVDKGNHCIDSVRYATEAARKARPADVDLAYSGKRSRGSEVLIKTVSEPDDDSGHEGAVADPGGRSSEYSRRSRRLPDAW
jgi:phage terminase large subunit